MANSGQMTTSNKYIVYRIECYQNSQNIANNTSNVTVKVWFWRTNTGYETYGSGTCYCKVNGTTYSQAVTSSQKINNSGIYLFSTTLNIGHNSDGTKTLNMSAWISHSQFNSSEQSYNQALSTIPRTSSASLSNYGPNFGNTITVNINRASGNFTHTVQQDFYAGAWSNIATGVATSCNWTIPNEYMNRIPNSTSGGGRIRVITYNGGTYIGEVVLNFTAYVPSSVVPVVTALNTSPVGIDVGGYVEGKHQVRVSMSGNWNGGANYGSVSINVAGTNYNGTSTTSNIVYGSGNKTVSTTMVDSRGRTGTKSTTISFWQYWNPTCNISVFRCNSNGDRDDVNGTYAKITVNGNACNVGSVNRNTTTCTVQYKRASNSSWINHYTITPSISGSNYVISDSRVTNDWYIDVAYDIRVVVSDKWATSTANTSISTGFTTIDIKGNGRGVAIGKISEKDAFEVNMDVIVKGQFLVGHCPEYVNNGTDFNNLTRVGDYFCSANAETTNNINMPAKIAFYLEVRKIGGMKLQRFYTHDGVRMYIRYYADWSSTWSSWFTYSNDASISDINEKKYIETLDVSFERLFDDLKPMKYMYEEKYNDDKTHLGFIAQDISSSLKTLRINDDKFAGLFKNTYIDMDTLEEKTTYMVNYQEFIPLNTYMIQRQKKELSVTNEVLINAIDKIDQLTKENLNLREELLNLRYEVDAIKKIISNLPSSLDK